ncbi:hypothetical protein PRIPAC_77448 [Pristionchus pacificus]|uniref:Nuclear receptor n=1 Tax=Pristionchus pacificus TaxID=54126 RepID=A0A2A6CKP0_PRIPA|nr:hypothetical protein PRIPAC_77448 [Pristionchus pacificus]|eukprot:PDM78676.1 nuclear receptor [Pristionchus pacificus]
MTKVPIARNKESMESSPPSVPDRRCLVCGAPTTSAHYGVDACRACTVFYRKARKRQPYACRTGTRKCKVTQDSTFTCKRCRFDRFEQILKQSGAREQRATESPASLPRPIPPRIPDLPSVESSAFSPAVGRTPRPLLDKCAICYKLMCAMRRNSELNARPNPPHPSKINSGEYEIPPSTYKSMDRSSRFFVTSILDLSETLYPEFTTFTKEDQWTLAVSFYNKIFMFDAAYRADKVYPDDTLKCLGEYTAYMSAEGAEHFFDDCPNESANVEDAKRQLVEFIGMALPSARIAIRRAKLDENEFLAVLILTFWFADCLHMRDEIVQTSERYRQQVLRELQAHYREDLKLDDYAARIGELFMLIFNFDRNTDVQEQFEMYRLLGVFADDTFVYRLQTRSE